MTEVLTAAAAVLASATGLLTLLAHTVISARREQRRWMRDAIVDSLVHFLDSSWRSSDAIQGLVSDNADNAASNVVSAKRAYEDMRSHLTRLSLLAPTNIITECRQLLRLQRHAVQALTGEQSRALDAVSAQRQIVITAAKGAMHVESVSLRRSLMPVKNLTS